MDLERTNNRQFFPLFEPAAFARAHTHSGSGSTPSMQQYNGGRLVEAVYLDLHLPLLSIHLPSTHSQVCVHYSLWPLVSLSVVHIFTILCSDHLSVQFCGSIGRTWMSGSKCGLVETFCSCMFAWYQVQVPCQYHGVQLQMHRLRWEQLLNCVRQLCLKCWEQLLEHWIALGNCV